MNGSCSVMPKAAGTLVTTEVSELFVIDKWLFVHHLDPKSSAVAWLGAGLGRATGSFDDAATEAKRLARSVRMGG